ncbi:unnamed protein product, partial [Mesorhabditis spiculigera]
MSPVVQRCLIFLIIAQTVMSCLVPPCPWRPYRNRHRLTKKEIVFTPYSTRQMTSLGEPMAPVCPRETQIWCEERCCDTETSMCLSGFCLEKGRIFNVYNY